MHILSGVVIRPILKKITYELLKYRNPNISYLSIFDCKCFILNNDKEKVGKFNAKIDEGVFLDILLLPKLIEFSTIELLSLKN